MAKLSRKVSELEGKLLSRGGGESERVEVRIRGDVSLLVVAPLVSKPPPQPPVLHCKCDTTQKTRVILGRCKEAEVTLAAPRLWVALGAALQGGQEQHRQRASW